MYRVRCRRLLVLSLAAFIFLPTISSNTPHVYARQLTNSSLKISNGNASEVAQYTASFTYDETDQLGAISLEICSNSPIESVECDAPGGLDVSQVTLGQQSGETGFAIAATTTANRIDLSRASQAISTGSSSYVFDNIVNPLAEATYFVKVRTFAASDTSGQSVDFGAFTYEIYNSFLVQAEVPPFLYFCVANTIPTANCEDASGSSVDLGEFSSRQASAANNEVQVLTNAASGYNVRVTGTSLASGSNVIAALTENAPSSTGTSQFGINLRANQSPRVGREMLGNSGAPTARYNIPNSYRFVSGDVVASSPRADVVDKYTVSYVVNIPQDQAPGIYVSTLTYICLANF